MADTRLLALLLSPEVSSYNLREFLYAELHTQPGIGRFLDTTPAAAQRSTEQFTRKKPASKILRPPRITAFAVETQR
jgi:hypothetical protein